MTVTVLDVFMTMTAEQQNAVCFLVGLVADPSSIDIVPLTRVGPCISDFYCKKMLQQFDYSGELIDAYNSMTSDQRDVAGFLVRKAWEKYGCTKNLIEFADSAIKAADH